MQVVEGGNHLQRLGQQHAVTKYIPAHVADTDHRHRIALHINTKLTEVPLHRDPSTPGGNSHRFVVITVTAPGGKGIAQPKAATEGNIIGNIGKTRRALIRRNHQVGVVVIAANDRLGRHHTITLAVIGNIQQAANKQFVAGHALGKQLLSRLKLRRASGDKAPFSTGGNYDGIFHLLRFYQPQDFGAVILQAVGPAYAAARNFTAPQMDAFHSRRKHKYLVLRAWCWRKTKIAGADLQRNTIAVLQRVILLKEVTPQRGVDTLKVLPQHLVLIEVLHFIQRMKNAVS